MLAFLREVGPHLERCELTHLSRKPIKIERARKQHEAYAALLREFGARIEYFRPLPDCSDGVFVENTAVVLPEVAIIARPGTPTRLQEIETVAPLLAHYRPLQRIQGSGHLDGGDVLRIGSTIYVAQSHQTNVEGIDALREIVDPYGYDVRTVELRDCRSLKTGCTFIPPDFIVVNPAWVDVSAFDDWQVIKVDPGEPFAANTLTLLGTTMVSAAFSNTEKKLQAAGIATRSVDISELQKTEFGLTSLSVILESRARKRTSANSVITPIKTPTAPPPRGHYAQAVVHGGLVYVSGQLPLMPASARVAPGEIEAQTEQTLTNLAAVLAASGSSLGRVLRMTVYLIDRTLIDRADAVIGRVLGGHRPARLVQSEKSLPTGCLVEIEVIAAVADD